MNANATVVAALAVLLTSLALPACQSTPPAPIDISRAVAAGPPPWEDALRLEAAGRAQTARAAYEGWLVQRPDDVELHRAYQKLLSHGAAKAGLFERYRQRLEQAPEDPAAHYLYGRLFNDPGPKRRHFRRALELDPSFAWALHGLGTMELGEGDLGGARSLLYAALAAEPTLADTWTAAFTLELASGDIAAATHLAGALSAVHATRPRGPLLMAQLANQAGDRELAIESWLEALARQPDSESTQRVVRRHLIVRGDPGAWRRALAITRVAVDEDGPIPEVLVSLGHYQSLLGNPWRAYRHFREAEAVHAPPVEYFGEMRRLAFLLGDYVGGFESWKRSVPAPIVEAPENRLRPAWEALERAAHAAMGAGEEAHEARRELGRACEAVGWLAEARHVWAQVAAIGADKEASEALDRIEGRLAFEDGLARLFVDIYAGRRPDLAESLDAVLDRLRVLAMETVGRDVVGDPPVESYLLIGELLDPGGAGLMQYMREGNRFFLLGREAGGDVQATLMNIVSYREDVEVELRGTDLQFDEIVCESQFFGGASEAAGAEFAGATFEGFYYVQLDSVRRTAHELVLGPDFPEDFAPLEPRPAPTAEARTSTWEPLGVMQRIAHSLGWHEQSYEEAWPQALELVFDGVAIHEQGHLLDVAYYLPISANLWRGLGLLVGEGFSGRRVRATLEGRAQRVAIEAAASPKLALAHALGYLPNRESAPPHSEGFSALMDAFLEELDDRREEIPGLKEDANLLQQLDRLDDETIRRLARDL